MFKVNINFFFQKSIKRESFKLLLYNSLQTQKQSTLPSVTQTEKKKKKTLKKTLKSFKGLIKTLNSKWSTK